MAFDFSEPYILFIFQAKDTRFGVAYRPADNEQDQHPIDYWNEQVQREMWEAKPGIFAFQTDHGNRTISIDMSEIVSIDGEVIYPETHGEEE